MLWVSVAFGLLFWAAVFYGIGFRSGPRRLVLRLGGGLLLGGLVSNLVDHAIWGGARNFLLLGFKNPFSRLDSDALMTDAIYAAHPSFSPAAACILVGLVSVVVGAMIGKDKPAPKPVPPPRPAARPKPTRPRTGG
jgi:lipoprotein signal peptidase